MVLWEERKMMIPSAYPFAAIVGQEQVKKGLMIALVNPKAGGILIGGPKGTAKSTLVRSIREVSGDKRCVDLPLNATEDMLFGNIDLEYAIQEGKRKFLPGILAKANNNILYIDEVNLLRSELLTAILDTNIAGINRIEREGISFSHEANYIVIGTMNPEEGTLSAQILDRFGMYAETTNAIEVEERVQIVKLLLDFEKNRQMFKARYATEIETLAEKIKKAKAIVSQIEVSEAMMQLAAQMCAKSFCAGHRAEIYLLEAAKAIAALEERLYILPKDMDEAAMFVLVHRMRQLPQQQPQEQEEQEQNEQEENNDTENNDEQEESELPPPSADEDGQEDDDESESEQEDDKTEETPDNSENQLAPEEQTAEIDKTFQLPKMMLDMGKDRTIRRGSGKRSTTRTDLKQGRYVRASMPKGKIEDLAFDATIRAAAPFQRMRSKNGCALNIQQEDLRQKVREKRIGNTFLFLVDASGSMGARTRMKAVKGAIFYMLQEAYQKRDKVGMIAFRRDKAEVLLPITRSVDLAQKCLQQMPTGGKTPLAEGLDTALMTLTAMNKKDKEQEPVLVLLTDGRANAGEDAVKEAMRTAERLRESNVTSVVIDTETDFIKLGIAKNLAREMGATYFSLKQLSQENIVHIVRNVTAG